jgi:hypothetical protein
LVLVIVFWKPWLIYNNQVFDNHDYISKSSIWFILTLMIIILIPGFIPDRVWCNFQYSVHSGNNLELKQGITNKLALPIDKMLYIYLLCPHSEHQKNPFQSKQSKHFHQRNQFT